MRILYDGEIYSMQMAGGINRYFASLIGRLPTGFAPTLLVARSCGLNPPAHPRLKIWGERSLALRRISGKLDDSYTSLTRLYWRSIIDSSRFDIAHPTYYQLVTRQDPGRFRCPMVLTVWDLIHELFPEQMDPEGAVAQLKRKAIKAADAIICISDNTRKDLLECYRVAEDRVKVTPLASDIDIGLSYGTEPVPSRPYYLYVGSRSLYKNFNKLLEAFANTVSMRPETALCVVGEPLTITEQRVISDLKLAPHIESYAYLNDTHLAKLYRCSIALVYPSLYEGFGLPPLEAMACGTAVIASKVSSIPEVVGKAGLLFDPTSSDELTDRLLFLLDNPEERERLVAKGRERGRAFSWDKTVAETLEIYREVSGSSELQKK